MLLVATSIHTPQICQKLGAACIRCCGCLPHISANFAANCYINETSILSNSKKVGIAHGHANLFALLRIAYFES